MLVNCVCSQDAIKLAEVEFQRERGMVDEVLRRIALEDCAEVALRRSKQEETKAFIAAFLKEQDEKKRAALESSAKEDRKIAEYWQMVRVGREWREEAGGGGQGYVFKSHQERRTPYLVFMKNISSFVSDTTGPSLTTALDVMLSQGL